MLSDTTSTATIKIADFGLARFFADGSQLRTICGSPLYVAPEILDIGACAETYTPAVDMWSVGVPLYILLSGNSPFDNEDERALFQTIKSGEYSMDDILWEHISDDAKDCVEKLLTVNTAIRMTASQALAHPWMSRVGSLNEIIVPRQLVELKQSRLAGRLESFQNYQEELAFALQSAVKVDQNQYNKASNSSMAGK